MGFISEKIGKHIQQKLEKRGMEKKCVDKPVRHSLGAGRQVLLQRKKLEKRGSEFSGDNHEESPLVTQNSHTLLISFPFGGGLLRR